jgi:transmembrane sensor
MSPDSPASRAAKQAPSTKPVDPFDWAKLAGKVGPVRREIDAVVRRRLRRRFQAACGAALLLLVAAGLSRSGRLEPGQPAVNSVAALPTQQVLPDGSIVESRAGARITVDYSGPLRRVVLEQGEAHFDVEKNQDRPFVVEAGGIAVRAVGTAFLVQHQSAGVEVVVTEGRVAVDRRKEGDPVPPDPSDPPPLALVDAGNRVLVDTAQRAAAASLPVTQPVTAEELEERMAWRIPRLEFSATPLSEVLPAFNRHSRVKVSLASPELGTLELSGALRANNVAALAQILESSYGLVAEQRSETEIVLRKGR